MAGMRMSMRKIREVLRLTHELGLSVRQVREATGVGKTAVCEYVNRARVVGIRWPVPTEIGDAELERRLFAPAGFRLRRATDPDWTKMHEELKRRGVTLMILWEEHRAEHVDGYGYSRFCELYGEWRRRLSPTMRQTHVAGDKLFVDWAGDTVPVIDPMTGEVHRAHLFVAALGASSYTYAEARWSETLPDWIGAHVNALVFIGGVPKAAVPDNLKAGITKPSRYEPGINRTYQDLADHYGFVVLPARIGSPRDKAKVEAAFGIVSRFVLGRLRNRRFFSLVELNEAVRDCVAKINAKVMKQLAQSRNDLWSLDRPALKEFPSERYQYAEWKRCTVAPDYHVEVDDHYYSVPFVLLRETVDARLPTARSRSSTRASGLRATCARARQAHDDTRAHAVEPSALRRMVAGTHVARGREDRSATVALFAAIMKAKPHPEQGFRSCLGIMSLVRTYGAERVEAASRRGNDIGATTYGSIKSILQERARSRLRQTGHARRVPDPARQYPWAWLLPLSAPGRSRAPGGPQAAAREESAKRKRGTTYASTSHTRPADRPRSRRHGQSVGGAATAARHCFAHVRGAARPPRRSRGRRARKQAARHPAQVRQPQAERAIEDLNTKAARGLDKALFAKLATGDWIGRRQDFLITGKTGTGKSWLACALGNKACRDDRSVLYHRVPRLLDALALARGDGRYARLLKSLARVELLILDDWGLAPLTSQQGRDLLEIVDDRHGRGSTIVTSQLPVDHWHEVIVDPTIADAVLDRLVHTAHRLALDGETLRKPAANPSWT